MQDAYETLLDATTEVWLDPDMKRVPFWDVVRALSDDNVQYDVIMLPDGELREDDFTKSNLEGYPLIVVPDCYVLTEKQQNILLSCAREGSSILVYGRIAEGSELREKLSATGRATFVSSKEDAKEDLLSFMETFHSMYDAISPVECRKEKVGIQRYDRDGRTWIHILNYHYDGNADRVAPLAGLQLKIRSVPGTEPGIIVPKGDPVPALKLERDGDALVITLSGVGLYTILAF